MMRIEIVLTLLIDCNSGQKVILNVLYNVFSQICHYCSFQVKVL